MERKVPQNIEAEQAVLGAVFFEQGSMKTIVDKLAEQDFFSPNHQVIFTTMKTLFIEGIPIDYTTLSDRLEKSESFGQSRRSGLSHRAYRFRAFHCQSS